VPEVRSLVLEGLKSWRFGYCEWNVEVLRYDIIVSYAFEWVWSLEVLRLGVEKKDCMMVLG